MVHVTSLSLFFCSWFGWVWNWVLVYVAVCFLLSQPCSCQLRQLSGNVEHHQQQQLLLFNNVITSSSSLLDGITIGRANSSSRSSSPGVRSIVERNNEHIEDNEIVDDGQLYISGFTLLRTDDKSEVLELQDDDGDIGSINIESESTEIDLRDYENVPLTVRVNVKRRGVNSIIDELVTYDDISHVIIDLDDGRLQVWLTKPPYLLGSYEEHQADNVDFTSYSIFNSSDSQLSPNLLSYNEVHTLKEPGRHVISAALYGKQMLKPEDDGSEVVLLDERNVTVFTIDSRTQSDPTAAPVLNRDVPAHAEETSAFVVPGAAIVTGEHKKWHTLTLAFSGDWTAEFHPYNPFYNYRLDVTFALADSTEQSSNREGRKEYKVPGYFGCDGNAANSGSWDGPIWLVHFVPDEIGTWTYTARYTTGLNVSVSDDETTASPSALFFDGQSGTFDVKEESNSSLSSTTNRDFRTKGRLQLRHKEQEARYYFSETNEYFLKVGINYPTNFLSYSEFDDVTMNNTASTTNSSNDHYVDPTLDITATLTTNSFSKHIQDYLETDQTWMNGKGKGILGAINYLSSLGINAVVLSTLSIGGNTNNDVYPFISPDDKSIMDCSKLAQWEVVFEHANQKGIMIDLEIHLDIQANTCSSTSGLNMETKLYAREMIARFGHHLALQWNIVPSSPTSITNCASTVTKTTTSTNVNIDLIQSMIKYIRSIDPYHHPIFVQLQSSDNVLSYYADNGQNSQEDVQSGDTNETNPMMDGVNIPTNSIVYTNEDFIYLWLQQMRSLLDLPNSISNERNKLVVTNDIPIPNFDSLRNRDSMDEYDILLALRKIRASVWSNIMAGGSGVIFVSSTNKTTETDLSVDYRAVLNLVRWIGPSLYTINFFVSSEFHQHDMVSLETMSNCNARIYSGNAFCSIQSDASVIVIYVLADSEPIIFNFRTLNQTGYSIQWYDPSSTTTDSIIAYNGSVPFVFVGPKTSLGLPLFTTNNVTTTTTKDWVILMQCIECPNSSNDKLPNSTSRGIGDDDSSGKTIAIPIETIIRTEEEENNVVVVDEAKQGQLDEMVMMIGGNGYETTVNP